MDMRRVVASSWDLVSDFVFVFSFIEQSNVNSSKVLAAMFDI